MKQSYLLFATILLYAIFFAVDLKGQTLSVGTPVVEDAYRRAQLLGQVDSSVSFTSRPFFPSLSGANGYYFDASGSLKEGTEKQKFGCLRFAGEKGILKLLPVIWKQQYNSNHPEGLNDGAMIPARGYQTLMSGGLYAKYGWLSVQLMPEFVYAQNRAYQGFPDEQPDAVWKMYYNYCLNSIDLPERFGENTYKRAFWGQSSVRLTVGAVSLGLSNENLWWGPGMQNSLLMTNSAPGFKHITFNTVKPIRTLIGSFEGQIVAGKLDASGYPNIDPKRLLLHKVTYIPKPDDWRYLNGIVMSYQPKWVPGLFLGATRSFNSYHKDLGKSIGDFLPVITPITKKAVGDLSEDTIKRDQLASIFIRWVAPEDHQEIYFEYGREDHAYNLRDFLQEPAHTSGYILGFRKLIPLRKHTSEFINVHLELTQLEKNLSTLRRAGGGSIWYTHSQVRDGYTNEGQLLGAGIGSGGNMQSLNVSWVKGFKSLGIQVKRVVHNNNFFDAAIKDLRSHWVDLGGSLLGEWDYKNLLFNARLEAVSSMNYEFLYKPVPGNPPFYWDKGKDLLNVHSELSVTYRF